MRTLTKTKIRKKRHEIARLMQVREELIRHLKERKLGLFRNYTITQINHSSADPAQVIFTVDGDPKTDTKVMRARFDKLWASMKEFYKGSLVLKSCDQDYRRYKLHLGKACDAMLAAIKEAAKHPVAAEESPPDIEEAPPKIDFIFPPEPPKPAPPRPPRELIVFYESDKKKRLILPRISPESRVADRFSSAAWMIFSKEEPFPENEFLQAVRYLIGISVKNTGRRLEEVLSRETEHDLVAARMACITILDRKFPGVSASVLGMAFNKDDTSIAYYRRLALLAAEGKEPTKDTCRYLAILVSMLEQCRRDSFEVPETGTRWTKAMREETHRSAHCFGIMLIAMASAASEISPVQTLSKNKDRKCVQARMAVAAVLKRRYPRISSVFLANLLRRPDHTSVLHMLETHNLYADPMHYGTADPAIIGYHKLIQAVEILGSSMLKLP